MTKSLTIDPIGKQEEDIFQCFHAFQALKVRRTMIKHVGPLGEPFVYFWEETE